MGNLLLMFLILLPYCAFKTLGGVIGDGKLVRLFFVSRDITPELVLRTG